MYVVVHSLCKIQSESPILHRRSLSHKFCCICLRSAEAKVRSRSQHPENVILQPRNCLQALGSDRHCRRAARAPQHQIYILHAAGEPLKRCRSENMHPASAGLFEEAAVSTRRRREVRPLSMHQNVHELTPGSAVQVFHTTAERHMHAADDRRRFSPHRTRATCSMATQLPTGYGQPDRPRHSVLCG